MRIKKAEITSFGHFRQATFLFEPKNQLIYGLNEAGKSTLYQFIQAILFGFPAKRRKGKDYTPDDGSGFGGRLTVIVPNYGEIIIQRFKNKNKGKASLLFADGTKGDEEFLQKILYPLNLQLFQEVFTFQQEQLQQVEGLQEEKLHDALISLGLSGSHQLFKTRGQLQHQMEQLYRPRGRKQPLNFALQKYQSLKNKIHEKEAQEADFQNLVNQADDYQQEILKLEQLQQTWQQKQLKLEQQRLNWSNYQEYQELLNSDLKLRANPSAQETLTEVYQEYQRLLKEQEKLRQALEQFSGNQESARYYFYLENESRIKEILEQKVQFQRLLDEELRITQQLQQLAEKTGAFSTPPQPFSNEAEVLAFLAPLKKLDKQNAELTILLSLVTEQRERAENDLNQYEKRHPNLFAQKKKQGLIFYLAAVVLVILGLFISAPLRYLLIVGGLVTAVVPFIKKLQQPDKEAWQEKLGQLDIYEGQVAETKKQLGENQQASNNLTETLERELKRRQLRGELTESSLLQNNLQAQQFLKSAAEITELKERKKEIYLSLQEYQQEFNFLANWLPLQEKNLQQKLTALESFAKEMENIRFAQTYQENTVLQQRIHENQKQQQIILQEIQPSLKKYQLSYPSEIPDFIRSQKNLQQQQQRLQDLAENLADIYPHETSLADIESQLAEIQSSQERAQQNLRQLQENEQRLRLEIQQLQKDGTLDELYQKESQQQAEIKNLLTVYLKTKVEDQLLQDIATELSEQQLPELMVKAQEYLTILTGKQPLQLDFIAGQLLVNQRSVYNLSTGTKDQLIMAFRFAYLALQTQQILAPIIIDDGWLHYDQTRKKQLAKLFVKFSENYQIICLSSDQEMVSYYQELHQPVWELKGAQYEKN